MPIKTKHIAVLPVNEDPNGSLPAIVVPRLMRIQDAAKYLSATTWQVETLLREKIIPSFVLGKRRVVDRLELDRYVERRNAEVRTETSATKEGETHNLQPSRQ
jgi:excisionase family DNA binding protein